MLASAVIVVESDEQLWRSDSVMGLPGCANANPTKFWTGILTEGSQRMFTHIMVGANDLDVFKKASPAARFRGSYGSLAEIVALNFNVRFSSTSAHSKTGLCI